MSAARAEASRASRDVLGRGSLYTLATAAPILAGVVVTPFVTRLLGAEQYGVVATALVIIQVGAMLAGLGLAAAVTRHGILERSGVDGARALVWQGAGLSAGLLVLAVGTGPWWLPAVVGLPWRPALACALAAAAGFAVLLTVQAFLRVLDRPVPFVGLSVVASLGGPLAGLALLRLAGVAAEAYVAGLLIGYAAAGVLGLGLTLRGGRPRSRPGDLRRALRLGLPTVPHQVALYLAGGAMVLIAGRALGVPAGGRLQLALLLGTAPAMVTAALNNAWAPVIYRLDPARRGPALERTARDVAALAAGLAGGVALLAPWLLRLLAPPSYAPAGLVPAVGVVAIGSVLSVAYLANVHLVFAGARSAGLAVVTPLSLVAGVLAAALAAPSGQLTAVAAGFPVAYLALAVGTAVLRRKVSATRWAERVMAAPLLGGVLLGVTGALLPATGTAALVRLPLAAALAAACALLVLRVLRR